MAKPNTYNHSLVATIADAKQKLSRRSPISPRRFITAIWAHSRFSMLPVRVMPDIFVLINIPRRVINDSHTVPNCLLLPHYTAPRTRLDNFVPFVNVWFPFMIHRFYNFCFTFQFTAAKDYLCRLFEVVLSRLMSKNSLVKSK